MNGLSVLVADTNNGNLSTQSSKSDLSEDESLGSPFDGPSKTFFSSSLKGTAVEGNSFNSGYGSFLGNSHSRETEITVNAIDRSASNTSVSPEIPQTSQTSSLTQSNMKYMNKWIRNIKIKFFTLNENIKKNRNLFSDTGITEISFQIQKWTNFGTCVWRERSIETQKQVDYG